MRVWSPYQEAVFADLPLHTNKFVNAVAGSGKTTLIEEVNHRIPMNKSILDIAFTCSIRDELKSRLGMLPNVTVANFNGFGNQLVKANTKGWVKVDVDKTQNILFFEIFQGKKTSEEDKKKYYKIRHSISRLIGLFKAHMIWVPTDDDIVGMAMEHDIKLPDEIYEFFDILRRTYAISWTQANRIDFDDQLVYPLYFKWDIPQFDMVLVDESQDLNPAQIEISSLTVKPEGQIIYVGDPRQAIYQFRGADKHAVASIITKLNCTEYPLSVCYRCSKAVVREAQRLVPHIMYADDAVEGSVSRVDPAEYRRVLGDSDVVLCRTTAPLVSECLGLIASGRKAVVKGREMAETLAEYLMVPDDCSSVELIEALDTEYQPKINQLQAIGKPEKAINLTDVLECIRALAESCKTVGCIRQKIETIFAKDSKDRGIQLMTVHKAKGLEAENVHIIRPDLIPHPRGEPESENNIAYVAITRAKVNLYYVDSVK